jgi:hypothetical protein
VHVRSLQGCCYQFSSLYPPPSFFQVHLGDTPNNLTDADFDDLAAQSEGYSGSDVSVAVCSMLSWDPHCAAKPITLGAGQAVVEESMVDSCSQSTLLRLAILNGHKVGQRGSAGSFSSVLLMSLQSLAALVSMRTAGAPGDVFDQPLPARSCSEFEGQCARCPAPVNTRDSSLSSQWIVHCMLPHWKKAREYGDVEIYLPAFLVLLFIFPLFGPRSRPCCLSRCGRRRRRGTSG